MMTPMIDVVFLLLIFFMVTYTQAEKYAQTVSLARSSTSKQVNVQKILVVTLTKQGDIYIGKEKISRDKLKQRLKEYVKTSKEKRIILRGDEYVNYGKLMELMDLAKNSGVKRVSLATEFTKKKEK